LGPLGTAVIIEAIYVLRGGNNHDFASRRILPNSRRRIPTHLAVIVAWEEKRLVLCDEEEFDEGK